jgi:hypothetical protein
MICANGFEVIIDEKSLKSDEAPNWIAAFSMPGSSYSKMDLQSNE